MTDISLRTYFEEIDGMIDGTRVEEAIAHLKHILGIYPKNLEAYRLLAKSLLEKNKHLDAADVFQRVLSSVPDDFISHVGMAVVREDEGNLDAAIWHMERAYEVQPSNGPVQEELRRLYGKRDGMDPPRLRLSRGALARMYEKGSLYPQAIAELRAALVEDPDRLDLKVLLASSLWHTRQRAEAAETSARLLEVLPFCREANRILAHVWDEEGHATESQNYKHRLEALDPYEAYADPTQNGTGAMLVPAEQVQVPRLENVYGETATDAARPDWMEALGIQYDQATAPGATPETQEWLNVMGPTPETSYTDSQAEDVPSSSLPGTGWLEALRGETPGGTGSLVPPPASVPANDIPDWMRSSVAEPAPNATDAPDWLAGISAPTDSVPAAEQGRSSSGMTDWLTDLYGEQAGAPAQPTEAAEPPATGDVPDWLNESAAASAEPGEPAPGHSGMTGWLSALHDDAAPAEPAPAGPTMTGWLSELHDNAPAPQPTPVASSDEDVPSWLGTSETADAAPPTLADDVPDWMKPAAPIASSSEGEIPAWLATAGTVEPTTQAQGDIPAWLTGADEPEPTPVTSPPDWQQSASTTQPAISDDIPAWLAGADEPAELNQFEAATPGWSTSPTDAEGVAEPSAISGDVPDWLKASQAEDAVEAGDIPAWLNSTDDRTVEIPTATAWAAANDDTHITRGKTEPIPAETPAESDVPSWLADSSATPAASDEGDVPDWLKAAPAETVSYEAAVPVASLSEIPEPVAQTPASTLPDWLASVAAEPVAAEPEMTEEEKAAIMEQAEEEIPEWMATAGWIPRDPTIPLDSATNMMELEMELPGEGAEVVDENAEPEPAELPDWLKAMKPPEEAKPAVKATSPDTPSWLKAAMEGEATEPGIAEEAPTPAAEAPAQKITAADLPDWLNTATGDPGETIVSFLKSKPKTGILPPFPDDTPVAAAVEPDDIPDWLKLTEEPKDSVTPAYEIPVEEPADEPVAQVAAAPAAVDPNNMTADEALAWLESLAVQHGAAEEELVSQRGTVAEVASPEAVTNEVLETAEVVSAQQDSEETLAEGDLPDWLRAPAEAEPQEPAVAKIIQDEPEALAVVDSQPEAEVVATDSLPDWLKAPDEPAAADDTPVTPVWSQQPAETSAEAPVEATSDFDSDAAAIAWLESLAAKHGAAPEELVSTPEDHAEQLPDWLRDSTAAAEAEAAVTEAAADLAGPAAPEPVDALTISDELPEWLRDTAATDETVTTTAPVEAETEPVSELAPTKPLASRAEITDDFVVASLADTAPFVDSTTEEVVVDAVVIEEAALPAEAAAAIAATDAQTEVPASSMSDDETLAWLESLAVKQETTAEEPVSASGDRSDDMPEWLREQAEAEPEAAATAEAAIETPVEEPVASVPEEKPDWLKQVEAESDEYEATLQAPPAAEPATAEISEDAAMAWLESLALKHGAAAEELVSQPAARSEEMPEWVKTEAETENAAIAEAETEAQAEAEPVAAEITPDSEKPDWLKQMEAESDAYEASAAPTEAPAIEPTAELEVTELPAWLSTPVADEELDVDIVSAWTPPAPLEPDPEPETVIAPEPEPAAVVEPEPEPEMPTWLTEQPVQPEPEPAWIPASAAKSVPVSKRAAPKPVAETETPEPAPAAKAPSAEPKPKRVKKTGTTRKRAAGVRPSKLRRSEAPEIVLSLARERLVDEKVGEAVEVYSELIASNNLLGDIIADLEAATLKRPEQPELLRTLGDAYMRDNQLQRALDAYKQALKKL